MSLTDWKVAADHGTVVPVIDIGPFLHGDEDQQAIVAAEVGAACEEIGFFLITGHGVARECIEAMYDISADFFSLPVEVKAAFETPTNNSYRGYRRGTFRETLEIGRYDDPDAIRAAGYGEEWVARAEANVWPSVPTELQSVWRTYFATCEQLAISVMEILAQALGLDRSWFATRFDRHTSYLSANHYPGLAETPDEGFLRLGEHTDIGSLTILYQDGAPGGLEVLDRRGRWCGVPAVEGSFVVNLGDLMAKWTNDRWIATRHRVVSPNPESLAARRISIPFFQHPNYDALIECIPTCADDDRPARYPAVLAGNWAEFRMSNYETDRLSQ
jgi:isopenicillin N synthase-like dioxygenase